MIYLRLFLSFLQIGAFSFGGGYAALPLIRHQVVEANGWLQLSEFTDLITIAQMTPGPIAVNSATFVGLKVAGIPGAVICTLGCVLPSCILVSLIAKLYLKYRSMDLLQGVLKGLRPAVVALIASAGVDIMVSALNIGGEGRIKLQMAVIFAICLALLRKKWNPILVMVLAGVMQVIYGYIMNSKWFDRNIDRQ